MSVVVEKSKRGDTIIEVCFAVAVYSLVAVLTIALMNLGTNTAQTSLELTMARNEIDAQSEVIRFIHNSYLSEREQETANQEYLKLWNELKNYVMEPDKIPELSADNCSTKITEAKSGGRKPFIVNTRKIDPGTPTNTIINIQNNTLKDPPLYPRVIFQRNSSSANNSEVMKENISYDNVAYSEGIWVFMTKSNGDQRKIYGNNVDEYYDFHIRTCWFGSGAKRPTTIGTIIRLYNPEIVEAAR